MDITEMDLKCARISETKAAIADLNDKIDSLDHEIAGIKDEVQQYFTCDHAIISYFFLFSFFFFF